MALVEVIKFEGTPDMFAWKYPNEEISTWSQLVVSESQEAVLFKDGRAYDVFSSGRYTLDTKNIPLLNKVINLPFGGESPFTAEIWFVNKVHSLDIKWGTPTPIQFQDPRYKVFVPIRSYGQFGVQIEDAKQFLIKLVGTLTVFDKANLVRYFRGLYLARAKDAISSFLLHKQISVLEINAYLDEISDAAKAIGAVNCIVNRDGKLYGHNTDYAGFLYTLRNNNIKITGEKVLVLGNGGAAKAIVAALESLNPKELITVKYKEEPGVITYEQAEQMHSDASVIVNTSPVGMYPKIDASPMDIAPYKALTAVVDIIYNPTTTKLLAQAKGRGITAVNGLEMLVAQAKYAVELFLDTEMPDTKIEEVMETLFSDK